MKLIPLFLIVLSFVLGSFTNSAKTVEEEPATFNPNSPSWTEYLVNASDGAPDDLFGASIAISNATMVVGAVGDDSNRGSAYVYLRDGVGWSLQQKLTAIDGSSGDFFGQSVAISGEKILVGAPGDNSATGSAYVFERTGSVWVLNQRLAAPFGLGGDAFGISVAIRGDTILIGAGDSTGSVYIAARDGTLWTFRQRLLASDGAPGDDFGTSVAIADSETLIVGARRDDSSTGSAYVFMRDGSSWSEHQKLIATDGRNSDFFGSSVAISGDTIVVGAFGDNTPLGSDSGSAYIFTRNGLVWSEAQKLMAADGSADDRFGTRVAIQGETVAVGTHQDDSPATDQGSAYIFARSGAAWSQDQKLVASDGVLGDNFGYSVALSGETVVIGAIYKDTLVGSDAGSVYSFDRECGSCVSISGRVSTPAGLGLRNAMVSLIDDAGVRRVITTSSFGIYSFIPVVTGRSYTLTVASKRYRFASRSVAVQGTLAGVDFTGLE